MSPAHSPFLTFDRAQWAQLRKDTAMSLSESDIAAISGVNEELSASEVEDVYLPLSRLLSLHVAAVQELHRLSSRFLGTAAPRVPYVIAIGGSVAAGKSTIARLLQMLLSRWDDQPRVELVTTDGFLYPTKLLVERELLERKGFPESYDRTRLLSFLADLKSGFSPLHVPVYSHILYDVLPDEHELKSPDIVILEGLNVLQSGREHPLFVSDFIDFSIYVDASEADLRGWFLSRFRKLRETAFQNPESYFHNMATMSEEKALDHASNVWQRINLVNLRENIAPTRERARLILQKGKDHEVEQVRLRKM
jgi:type I pantothenate kinase